MSVKNIPPGGPVGPAGVDLPDAPDALDAVHTADAVESLEPGVGAQSVALDPAPSAIEASSQASESDPVARLAHALDAHEITPDEAVSSLVELSLDAGLMAALPASEQAALREELFALIESDPTLARMSARLGARGSWGDTGADR